MDDNHKEIIRSIIFQVQHELVMTSSELNELSENFYNYASVIDKMLY